ncbi:hypothetical protein [Halorubrum ezzemoulense]|nr:hypothetical protein [Halorubrum ezzemoulense]
MADTDTSDEVSLAETTEWDGGFSWIAYPDEDARRASHALTTDAGVWLVDPVDVEGLDEHLHAVGDVAGVIVLQDRHTRDAATVARRHDTAVSVPKGMSLTREKLDVEAEATESALSGSAYEVHTLRLDDDWEEAVLWNEERKILLVPETLGTLPSFREDGDAIGIHPAVEESPQGLAEWDPNHILVGHGASLHEEAKAALTAALGLD